MIKSKNKGMILKQLRENKLITVHIEVKQNYKLQQIYCWKLYKPTFIKITRIRRTRKCQPKSYTWRNIFEGRGEISIFLIGQTKHITFCQYICPAGKVVKGLSRRSRI